MMSYEAVDIYELLLEEEQQQEEAPAELLSASDALTRCLNNNMVVDMNYLCQRTGLTWEKVAACLKGIIFQDPDICINKRAYDPFAGWMLRPRYLIGNIAAKLQLARYAERHYPGRFYDNIEALSTLIPPTVEIGDIYFSLGSPWIPCDEIALFCHEFLNLKDIPYVKYYRELDRCKIIISPRDVNSINNNITYGVRDDRGVGGDRWVKQYLTATDIIELTRNARPVEAYDSIPTVSSGDVGYDRLLNKVKTVEAQDKLKALNDGFAEWVMGEPRRKSNFEDYYNRAFGKYKSGEYDGSFLELPGLNPKISIYPYQKNVIARALLSDSNLLICHDTGTGKTFEIICTVHELYRCGKSLNNLVVVPNNLLSSFSDVHRMLYAEDKLLVVDPKKDFTPQKRNATLTKIKNGDYVAVYMAASSFDMVTMSKEHNLAYMAEEINKLQGRLATTSDRYERRALESRIKALGKKRAKYAVEAKNTPWLCYEELGVTTLVVDEAHNYKNIAVNSIDCYFSSSQGSKKAIEMMKKVHFTDKTVFSTATPMTNSMADLYAMMLYLQPGVLELHGIDSFDSWISTFGSLEGQVECDVDANSHRLRSVMRYTSFNNLPELISLFSQVCDFYYSGDSKDLLPSFNGYTDIVCPKTPAQNEYIEWLSERTEAIRSKKVQRSEDNLLSITVDGRLVALDSRLVKDKLPFDRGWKTKVDYCAEKIYQMYKRYPDCAQMVLCDVGTPKDGFNIYDCLRDTLAEMGMQRHQIAFVHDADTDTARSRLFEDMNKGTLKVVVGSTQKLGVGVNVQERLVALHHLSVPWRPSDMVQREGRILRQGNSCKEVFIFRYITQGSFDAYSWQLLENKQRFIGDFLSGSCCKRSADDIADTVLDYAEVKALAVGNPIIKKRVEKANLLERTRVAYLSRQNELRVFAAIIGNAPEKINSVKQRRDTALQDFKYYCRHKKRVSRQERVSFGEELASALKENVMQEEEQLFDRYLGFDVILPSYMTREHPSVKLLAPEGGSYYCEMAYDKPALGYTRTIDYLLDNLGKRAEELDSEIEEIGKQVAEARAELERGNFVSDRLDALTRELADIDKELENYAKENKTA